MLLHSNYAVVEVLKETVIGKEVILEQQLEMRVKHRLQELHCESYRCLRLQTISDGNDQNCQQWGSDWVLCHASVTEAGAELNVGHSFRVDTLRWGSFRFKEKGSRSQSSILITTSI